jgi:hypothetical protein
VSFVENNFRWKKELLQVVSLKGTHLLQENVTEMCNKKPSASGPSQLRLPKIDVPLLNCQFSVPILECRKKKLIFQVN